MSDYAGNPFFSEVVAGIEEVCFEEEFSVFLSFSEMKTVKEAQIVSNFQRRGVEGVILHAVQPDDSLSQILDRFPLPLITFQRSMDSWDHDSLCTDDREGGRLVMDHLLTLGHRRIALITGEMFRSHAVQHRVSEYKRALKEIGQEIDPRWIKDGAYSFEGAYTACQELLALDRRPTAIFCISDRMALGCLSAAQDSGLHVPRDLSIVGFDNLDLLNYVRPRLTTVDHQCRESGRVMAKRLLQRIKQRDLPPEKLSIRPTLVVRETTGPCRETE